MRPAVWCSEDEPRAAQRTKVFALPQLTTGVETAQQAMSAAEVIPSRILLSKDEQPRDAQASADAEGLEAAGGVPPGGAATSTYAVLSHTLLSVVRRLELQSLLPHAALERDRLRPLGWHPRGCRLAGGRLDSSLQLLLSALTQLASQCLSTTSSKSTRWTRALCKVVRGFAARRCVHFL